MRKNWVLTADMPDHSLTCFCKPTPPLRPHWSGQWKRSAPFPWGQTTQHDILEHVTRAAEAVGMRAHLVSRTLPTELPVFESSLLKCVLKPLTCSLCVGCHHYNQVANDGGFCLARLSKTFLACSSCNEGEAHMAREHGGLKAKTELRTSVQQPGMQPRTLEVDTLQQGLEMAAVRPSWHLGHSLWESQKQRAQFNFAHIPVLGKLWDCVWCFQPPSFRAICYMALEK